MRKVVARIYFGGTTDDMDCADERKSVSSVQSVVNEKGLGKSRALVKNIRSFYSLLLQPEEGGVAWRHIGRRDAPSLCGADRVRIGDPRVREPAIGGT